MYNDTHRSFLQYMLKNSYVSTEKALDFCRKNSDGINDVDALKTFISQINGNISKHELKISFLKCEVTGEIQLALLNTGNDDISKLQNVFTPIELEYFQLLLKEIVISDHHKLQNMACFNLSSSLTGTLRKDTVEKLLKTWINGGYLVEEKSYVYLGPRCIVEFAPYFQIHCKDYYTTCHLCSEAVFTGKSCSSCNKLMHKHCMEIYLTKQNKCPSCKNIWNEGDGNRNPDLQEQDNSSEDENEDISPSGPSRSRKTRRLS